MNGLNIEQADITGAFLDGLLKSTETVFIKPYQGNKSGAKAYKLHKALYGLCQAALAFYNRINEVLQMIGYKKVPMEKSVW